MLDFPNWLNLISLAIAAVSLFFNLWQYFSYQARLGGVRGSLRTWSGWISAIKDSIDKYWETDRSGSNAAAKEERFDTIMHRLAKDTERLIADINCVLAAMEVKESRGKG